MSNITKKEFLDLFVKSNTNLTKQVKLNIKPKGGWIFELNCPITNVLCDGDDYVFISNSFSKTDPVLTVVNFIDKLTDCSDYDDKPVVFEIYAWDGTSNEQILITFAEDSDISFTETEDSVIITLLINEIYSCYSTKCEDNKFIIQRTDEPNLYTRWDKRVIVFDTIDEVNKHINENFYFYQNTNYKIIPLPRQFKLVVNYKDIVNTDEYKETCVYEA